MQALLLPLAKGLFGLMGISSFMFLGVKQEAQVQVREVKRAEAQLKKMEELHRHEIPNKPKQAPQKK